MRQPLLTPAVSAMLDAIDGKGQIPYPDQPYVSTFLREIAVIAREHEEELAAIRRGMAQAGIPLIYVPGFGPGHFEEKQ